MGPYFEKASRPQQSRIRSAGGAREESHGSPGDRGRELARRGAAVALLRAAAKNFADVIVIHDPSQYGAALDALGRGVSLEQRRAWAVAAFARTASYDAAIAAELARRAGDDLPPVLVRCYQRVRGL